jgi:hypothetical protein
MSSIPFTNGFYSLPATSLTNQRCVNWWTHISELPSGTKEQLLGFSGIDERFSTGFGKTRGSIVFKEKLYRVDGQNLVSIDVDLNQVDLGLITGFGRVSISKNIDTICIVDPNGNSYFYDEENGLAQITNADFLDIEAQNGRARTVTFSDGFFVFNTDEVIFQGSLESVNKGQDFNALEFEDAFTFDDKLVAVKASQNNVYVFSDSYYQVYRFNPNTTTGDFAFRRVSTQNNEKGLRGRFNIVNVDSALYFVGGGEEERSAVYELRGAVPKKISTDAIDVLIEDETSGFAMAWGERGQFFRSFTFPTTTIVYNARTGRWCEIQEEIFNPTKGWRVQTIDRFINQNIVSDDTGKGGILDTEYHTWFGDNIVDYFTTQPFANQQKNFAVQQLEIVNQSGVGNDDDENPSVALSFSDDGGVEFRNELYRELGKRGERRKRQVYRLGGRYDETVVMKVSHSNPCKKAVIDIVVDFI